jgi:hypothetical protein
VLSVLFCAGTAYVAGNLYEHYVDVSSKAAPLEQNAKQLEARSQAAAERLPHRALTSAQAEAAIAYIDTLRDPYSVNVSHGPISKAQHQALRRLLMTPGQLLFDPLTSPRIMHPGDNMVRASLDPRGVLYLDLYQGSGELDVFRYHAMMNADGTFNQGPEIITPHDFYGYAADRVHNNASAPDGPGSSVGEALTLVIVTVIELALTLLLLVAALLLLRKRSWGVKAHLVYAIFQLPMCFALAIVYASFINETAPFPIFDAIGLVPSLIVGIYTMTVLFVLRNEFRSHLGHASVS